MNWNGKDVALVEQQKNYIDTVVVPLASMSFSEGFRQSAEQYEFIQLLTEFLERQFKGRMLVTPPYAYLPEEADKAVQWAENIRAAGFKHVFFITADSAWRQREAALEAAVIFVPSVPLGDMEEAVKRSLIENQAKQLVNTIVVKWQDNIE